MALSLLAIACLLGAASAGPYQRDVASRCSAECPKDGDSKFNYLPGSKYVYNYRGSNIISGAANRKQQIAQISCTAEIYVKDRCEMSLQLKDVTLTKGGADQDEPGLIHRLETIPIAFAWADGKIEHICSSRDETVASENIKKSILSLIINTMSDLHSSSRHQEVDSIGSCDTKYNVLSDRSNIIKVRKEKSLSSCDNSLSGFTAIVSEQYSSPESSVKSVPIFTHDERTCEQEIRDRVIQRVICREQASVKPLAKYDSILELQAEAELTLANIRRIHTMPQQLSMDKKSILYNYQQEEDTETKENEAVQLLTEMCPLTDGVLHPKVSKLYYDLIMVLKGLPAESIQKIYESLKQKKICSSPKTLDLFLDALPMAGTEGSIKLMVDLLKSKQITGLKSKLWPASFALIPNPNSEAVAAVLPLISEEPLNGAVLLGLSAMIHRICSSSQCDQLPAVHHAVRVLREGLAEHCASENNEKVLGILKAFGNMGYLGEAEPTVLACAQAKEKPIPIRLAAVDAFRRSRKELPEALIQFYESDDEHFEIRIASLSIMIRNADSRVQRAIESVLSNSKDTQVLAFTKSLVSNWKKTTSPLKQKVKQLLQQTEVGRNDIGYWENSKHIELSTFNTPLNLGASVESSIVHSEGSKIPRSFASRVEIDLFGRNVNLFEFGVRAEGLERSLQKLMGRDSQRQSAKKKSWFPLLSKQESDEETTEASFYMRTMGMEFFDMSVSDITSMGNMMQVADVVNKLAQGKKTDFAHSFLFLNTKLIVQSVTGRSYSFGMTGSATGALTANGKFDIIDLFSSPSNCNIGGRIQPSVNIEFSTTIGIHSQKSRPAMKIVTSFHSGADLGAQLLVKDSHLAEARLDLPAEEMQLFQLSTELYEIDSQNNEKRIIEAMAKQVDGCLRWLEKPLGLQICAQLETPKPLVSRKFPYAHGIGNVQLSIRKSDPAMSGYALSLEIPKHKSNPMSYHLTLDTPGSSINRRFHSSLELRAARDGERHFKLDMKSPFKELSSAGSLVLRPDLLQCSVSTVADQSRRYSMKTVVEINNSPSKKTLKPTVQWTWPGRKPVSVSGSIVYDEGRKQHLMVDFRSSSSESKPIVLSGNFMKEGQLSFSSASQWKMSADLVAKSPLLTTKLHSTHHKRSGQSNTISSALELEYSTPGSQKHSLKFSSDVQRNTAKSGLVAQFETSQLPAFNWQLNWDMQGKLKDAMKNDIVLSYGEKSKNRNIQISQSHHVGGRDSLSEGTISLKVPHRNIDSELKIAADIHRKETSDLHFEMDLRYKEDKHVKSLLQMRRLSRKPVKMALKAVLEYPEHKAVYEDEITEVSPNIYQGQSKFQWQSNQKATLRYTYKRLSDNYAFHHEIESSLDAYFLRSPVTHSSMVILTREKFQIRSEIKQRELNYSLEANMQKKGSSYIQVKLPVVEGRAEVQNEEKKKSASLDMHLLQHSQRRVTAITAVSWGHKKSVQAELSWDSDRNPSRQIGVNADIEISRKSSGISYNIESKFRCLNIVSFSLSSEGKNNLRGPHKLTVEVSGEQIEPVGVTLQHELASGILRSSAVLTQQQVAKAVVDVRGKHSRSETELEYRLESPGGHFSKQHIKLRNTRRNSESSTTCLSEITMEMNGNSHTAKVEYNRHGRQLREVYVSVKTPYSSYEEQHLRISHRKKADSTNLDAQIGYNRKEITISNVLKNSKNEISITSDLKTPYPLARDMKIFAALEKQKNQKQIKSYLEFNGERKYDIASSYTSKTNRYEVRANFKTWLMPEEVSLILNSEMNLPSFGKELLVSRGSQRIFSCKILHERTGAELKSLIDIKTSKQTLLEVKAIKEVKSASIQRYSVKAKGMFAPVSVSLQSVETEENSLSKTVQVCRESPDRECYSLKAYYKKESNAEKYNKYRKITFDIEKEISGQVQHLCNVHYFLTVQGHAINSKFFIDSQDKKLGYDFTLRKRDQESEPCVAEISIILPSRTIKATVSALHSAQNVLYGVEVTPDVSVASKSLSLQVKRDRTKDGTTGYFKISHSALQKPVTVHYSLMKASSRWPKTCKIEIDYSPDARDKVTAELGLISVGRSQQKELTAKLSSPGSDLDLEVKIAKLSSRDDRYVCEWAWKSENEVKSAKLSINVLKVTPDGWPETSEILYSSPSNQLSLDVQTAWKNKQPSDIELKLKSKGVYLGEVTFHQMPNCVEYEIKDSKPFWRNKICYGPKEESQTKSLTFDAYHKRKCIGVSLELEPSRAQVANVGIQWDKEELRHLAGSFQSIPSVLRKLQFEKLWDEVQPKARGVYSTFMRRVGKPVSSSLADELLKLRQDVKEAGRMLQVGPTLRSVSRLRDQIQEKAEDNYQFLRKEILRYFEQNTPKWIKDLAENIKQYFEKIWRDYCSRNSLCYKMKTSYQRQGMAQVRRVVRTSAHQKLQQIKDYYQGKFKRVSRSFTSFQETISAWFDEIINVVKDRFSYLEEYEIYNKIATIYSDATEYVKRTSRRYFERFMDYLNRIMDHTMQNETFQLVSENMKEIRKQAVKSWKKLETKKLWKPIREIILRRYPKIWLRQRISIQEFNPKDGRVSIQVRSPFTQSHLQLLKNAMLVVKSRYSSRT